MRVGLFMLAVAMAVCANAEMKVERFGENVWRVRQDRNGTWPDSMLNRYGIIEAKAPTETSAMLPAGPVMPTAKQVGKGFELRFPLAKDERLYGLGDANRDNLNRRGGAYEIWVKNVTGYIPIPVLLSSRGWGVFVNTTRRHTFDVGKTDPDALVVTAEEGDVDFYFFTGSDYRALLDTYTRLTGRPKLLPIFAYGFTYVANQWVDAYQVVQEASRFRELGLPCDTIGLEPGWMEYFYDFTTKKDWNQRFQFPFWIKPNAHSITWIGALERMGFKLSLWLCMEYDLFVYEEACAAGRTGAAKKVKKTEKVGDTFYDEHITGNFKDFGKKAEPLEQLTADVKSARRMAAPRPDGLRGHMESGEEPWFDHLQKFVDRGARCFKLDGSRQVFEFKDRMWAGRYSDAEAHNAYPLVYDKQMCEGYEKYTGKRAMVYSAAGYAGVQRYVATWAGDTGGGVGPLVSTLNLGVSGHPNQSCDMTIECSPSLHFGFLSPWCQQNNWDYFEQPWYRKQADLKVFRNYLHLRYRLIPYIYTAAAEAARTGWPIMRPLAFVYPDVPDYANECGTYLLGDNLLVSAFVDTVKIPPGTWYEWRTGEKVVGPKTLPVKVTHDWGGALYVKAGAIIPMWPVKECLDTGWNDVVEIHYWPGADGAADLYEDDGDTLAHLKGAYAVTHITMKAGEKPVAGPTKGAFAGQPKDRTFTFVAHEAKE